MKTYRKLLVLNLLMVNIFLIGCNVKTPVSYTDFKLEDKYSIEEARNTIKMTVKDIYVPHPINIKITGGDIIFYYDDNTEKVLSFMNIEDPRLVEESSNGYVVYIGEYWWCFAQNASSAKKFASALAYLKNNYAQKGERGTEKEREDSLRRIQQTAIDEIKERQKKQEESLRLIQKTSIKDESGATAEETMPESASERRKSQPRPAPPKKSAVEPLQRQPEGASPPLPALPAGGAVSGN